MKRKAAEEASGRANRNAAADMVRGLHRRARELRRALAAARTLEQQTALYRQLLAVEHVLARAGGG